MAIVNFSGFYDILEGIGLGNTFSLQTSVVRTGATALRANPTTTNNGGLTFNGFNADGSRGNVLAVTDSYVQFWFRYATKPSSNDEEIMTITPGAGGTHKIGLRLDSSGVLKLYDNALSLIATGTTVLSQDTWYKLEVSCGTSATVGPYELKINDVSEFSGTGNTSANTAGAINLGKVTDRNSNSVDFFYDDFVYSDSAFISGDIAVKELIPDADGSTMSWSAGTGSSNYLEVDESPTRSDADYVQSLTGAGAKVALFDLSSTTTEGISGTMLAFKGLIATRENTSVTSATNIRVRSNTTNSDSSTRNGSTAVASQTRLLENDPDTGTAWTTGGLDAVEVGAVENNSVAVRCVYARGFVLYVPPAPTGQPFSKRTQTIPFLGGSLRTNNF